LNTVAGNSEKLFPAGGHINWGTMLLHSFTVSLFSSLCFLASSTHICQKYVICNDFCSISWCNSFVYLMVWRKENFTLRL